MSHGDHCSDRTHARARNRLDVLTAQTLAVLLALAAVPALAQYQYRRTITVDRTKVTNPATLPIAFDNVTSAITANAGASNLSWTHAVGSGNDRIAIVAVSSVPTAVTITADAGSSQGVTGSSNLSFSYTVGAGSNKALIVGVCYTVPSALTVQSVVWGTTSLSPIGITGAVGSVRVELWGVLNVTPGTANVAVTMSAATNFIVGVAAFSNVGAIDTARYVGARATGTNPTVTVTSAPGELVVDVMANVVTSAAGLPTVTIGGGQTANWPSTYIPSSLRNSGSRKAGASPNVTMSWTLGASVDWAIGAVPLMPAVVTQVTFDGTNITGNVIGAATNTGNCTVSMYYLKNPPAGSNTVSVTTSASTRFVAGAFTLFNVDQTTPFGPFTSGTASGSSSDDLKIFSVSSANGEIAVGALAKTYNYTIAPEAQNQQADRWNLWTTDTTPANNIVGIGSLRGGATSADFKWRLTNSTTQQLAFGGVSVKPTTVPPPLLPSLANYPLLVSLLDTTLKDAAHGGHVQNSSGYDIVFTDADGVTRLDHELEKYDGVNGQVVAWVKLPSVNGAGAGSDTQIYMYYGSPGITSPTQKKATVWDSNYMEVWHLAESGGYATDSTSHNYVGSITNDSNVSRQAAKIGGGYHFGGSSYIVTNDGTFATNDLLTMEAWFYLDTVPQFYAGIVTKNRDVMPCTGSQPPCHWAGIATGPTGELAYYWDWHTQGNLDTGPALSATTWYHAVLTFDGGIRTAYRNGVRDTIVTAPNPSPGIYDSLTMPSRINQDNLGSTIGTGIIDEVRISTVARTPGWVLTSYNNMNNPGNIGNLDPLRFYNVGNEGPIALYRSVGTNGANLNSGGPTVTISGTTATFGSAMPNNVGVGDALTYTSGTAQLAFISGRTSSTAFTVQDKVGGTPTAAPALTAVGVYRAYTSLYNWERQEENGNIVEPTEDDVNPSLNLVSANTIMNVACYGDSADTAAVTINGWTTSAGNYIKIFTPNLPSEVGATQRHNGKWDASKYSIQAANVPVVSITGAGNVWIDGLQIYVSTTNTNGSAGIAINQNLLAADHRISNNIIRGVAGTAAGVYGIYGGDAAASGNSVRIWNNIVFGFGNGTGIYTDGDNGAAITFYAYNNTVHGCNRGYMRNGVSAGPFVAKNNIAYSNTDNYNNAAAFDAASCNNLSGPGSDPNIPPTGARNGVPVTFVDTGSPPDLHLASSDAGAKEWGIGLSADTYLAFSDDIDGQGRPYGSAWDIGADEHGAGLFAYRRLITILNTMTPGTCSSDLANFPVLVSITNDPNLRTVANGGHVQNANGYDIVFRALDGKTQLDHEIESYVGVNGTLVAWVRIPTLAYNADTTFYMYYGDAGTTSPSANPTGVWNTANGWRGVWHLKESPSGTSGEIKDSTSYANNGTTSGTMNSSDQVTGKSDGSLNFDASTFDLVDFADPASLQLTGEMTASAWVWTDGYGALNSRFVTKSGDTPARGWELNIESSTLKAHFIISADGTDAGQRRAISTGNVPTGQWIQYVGVYEPSTAVRLYVNGVLDNSNTASIPASQFNAPNTVRMAARNGCANCYLDGKLDEIRVSSVARDACWINTEYNNQSTPGMVVTQGSGMTVKSGSYTGNAVDNRQITGLGFKPDIIIIKADAAQDPVCTTSSMPAYSAKALGSTPSALVANAIKSLGTDGFTLGTDARVNTNGSVYYWVAFEAGAGELKVGSYQGNGAARGITGVGFQPDWVVVMSSAAYSSRHRSSSMTNTAYFHDWASDATGITALGTDGFSVDTDPTVNTNGTTYHYFAFNKVAGKMNEGTYAGGTPSDDRNITGVGFQPEYVLVKASNDGQRAVAHPASLSGDSSLHFGAVVNEANHIQVLLTDGFQVGSSNRTNLSGNTYHWVAFGPSASTAIEQPAGPTAVRLTSFTATERLGGVLLEWRTGFEVDNLGFHVYRDQGGQRVRVTPSLIAGSALFAGAGTRLTSGQTYAWWDRSPVPEASYWLEEWDLSGVKRWHGPVQVQAGAMQVQAQGLATTPSALLAGLGVPAEQASSHRVRRQLPSLAESAEQRRAVQWWVASQPVVKLVVREEGWYRVTQEELAAAGFDPEVDSRRLQLFTDGQEVPILVDGEAKDRLAPGDAIEFYGVGLDTPSTDARVYWLVAGTHRGLRLGEESGRGQWSPGPASFPYEVERADRTIYVPSLLNGEESNFFGPVVAAKALEETVQVRHLDPVGEATLAVRLQGVTMQSHRVGVQLNGVQLGTVTWTDLTAGEATLPVATGLLREGDNLLTLIAEDGEADISLVDHLRLTYPHTWEADGDALRFTVEGFQEVTIGGFASPRVRVFDVTEPMRVVEVSAGVVKDGEAYRLTVGAPEPGTRIMLAVGQGAVRRPALVANTPSTWHAAREGVDLVIVAHRSVLPAVEPLRALRERQGLKVAVVDVQEVYDEFSFGVKDSQAIRDFLVCAKATWSRPPRYLLLVGDASYDSRNYLGFGELDLVPTKFVDTTYMETASDDWFADFDGDDIADIPMGRLPVATLEEAAAVVAKIVAYEGTTAANRVLLVADANDKENDFEAFSGGVKALVPASLIAAEVFRGQLGDAAAKQELSSQLNLGQTVVNYIGHGSMEVWHGNLLTTNVARTLEHGRLPLWLPMTCLNGYFQAPYGDSLAEALLKAPAGGAVAVWASSGLTESKHQLSIDEALMHLLFSGPTTTLGDATLAAKVATSDSDVRRTWIFFGDPTTRLRP